MSSCILNGYGPCSGKITGAHYISGTILEAIEARRTKALRQREGRARPASPS